MGDSKRWFVACLGAASLFASVSLAGVPIIGQPLLALAALCVVAFVAMFIGDRRSRKYSFGELQRVHERAEIEELDPGEVEGDWVFCPNCQAAYPPEFPTCPGCATRR